MDGWVKNILEAERKKRNIPLEVKKLNNNYYLYRSTTRWDKESQKVKKVTEYIGRMTPKGVIDKKPRSEIRSIYEYGNSEFLYRLSEDIIKQLKFSFYDNWEQIIACAMVKTLHAFPLRLIQSQWEKLHISQKISAALSPNSLSSMLRKVGSDYYSQKEFFDALLTSSELLAFDLSYIFSYSENLNYAEKGYNSKHRYLKQVNILLFFSIDKQIPVLLRPIPGSIREIKTIKSIIDELNGINTIIVLDRAFCGYQVQDLLMEKDLDFIIPLKKNFKIIDYNLSLKDSFIYNKRGIKWGKKQIKNKFLYLFEDVHLRSEEETNFIELMVEGKRSQEDYEKALKSFGKIAIISNLDLPGKKIFLMYKDRVNIEVAFDALKNELENDKSYLGDDDAIRGYFFISFISLLLHYRIMNLLKEKDMTGMISVNEVLLELSKVYQINIGDKSKFSPVPKKTWKLENQLGLDIFPKKL